MQNDILQLFPPNGKKQSLEGLYLSENIRQCHDQNEPFIYSNFVTSIDGRIALPVEGKITHQVPPAIGNARDWRLFQELAAQADILITTSRYFRQASVQEAQDTLPVGPAFSDLKDWRKEQGLKEQPDLAVFSASLNIPVAALAPYRKRRIFIFTGQQSDPEKRTLLENESHARIIVCGEGTGVDGGRLRAAFTSLNYSTIYAIAGPRVLHTLANGKALDRLYLTTAHRLLGGNKFDTISSGSQLLPAMDMPLLSLYYDPVAPDNIGQTLASYGK
ncbi:MAG: dihydrofolate reductase family protein [Gammaproteobacteria bacterium]